MTLRLPAPTRLFLAVVALSTVVGLAAAKLNTSGRLHVAAAATHVLVDYPDPSIVKRRALPQHVSTLQRHADLLGRLIATPPVLKLVGRRVGISADEISARFRTTDVEHSLTQPVSEERATQIGDSRTPISPRASG